LPAYYFGYTQKAGGTITEKLLNVFSYLMSHSPFEAHEWQKHSIGDIVSPIYLVVDDLDGDTDLDVAAGSKISANPVNSEVAWFENDLDESGTFTKRIISPATPDSEAIQNVEVLASVDVDKDGQKDIAVSTGRITNQYGGLYWFKSPENFQGNWIRYSIYEPVAGNSFFKLYTIDTNKDTWPDFVVGGDSGAYLFLNPTTPSDPTATWNQLLLHEYSGSSTNLADVDQDGMMDILNTNTGVVPPENFGNVSWFKINNAGGKVSMERKVIDAALEKPFDVTAMDINGDGYPEVFVSIFNAGAKNPDLNGIYWYENPGSEGGKWIKHVVDPNFSASDMDIGDINGDGQDDLVASGLFIGKISWFEYQWKGGTAEWTEHVIDPDVALPGDISVNDIDNDKDLDIVVTVLKDDELVWYENLSAQTGDLFACPLEIVLSNNQGSLNTLRKFRDTVLSRTSLGKTIIELYYSFLPLTVRVIEKSPTLKEKLKGTMEILLPIIERIL
jgi:hypothetical protein